MENSALNGARRRQELTEATDGRVVDLLVVGLGATSPSVLSWDQTGSTDQGKFPQGDFEFCLGRSFLDFHGDRSGRCPRRGLAGLGVVSVALTATTSAQRIPRDSTCLRRARTDSSRRRQKRRSAPHF